MRMPALPIASLAAMAAVPVAFAVGCATGTAPAIHAPLTSPKNDDALSSPLTEQHGIKKIAAGLGILCQLSGGRVTCEDLCSGRKEALKIEAVDFELSGAVACLVRTTGAVACWRPLRQAPVAVRELGTATGVSVGLIDACALGADGSVRCVRFPGKGYVPWESWPSSSAPRPPPAPSLDDAVQMSAPNGTFCVTRESNQVWCSGQNGRGQAGDGPDFVEKLQLIPAVPPSRAVSTAFGFSCSLALTGIVTCWGDLRGWNAGTDRASATPLPNVSAGEELRSSAFHACVVESSGALTCWGAHHWPSGQIAPGGPTRVPGIGPVSQVATGMLTTCVLTRAGSVKCWGSRDRWCDTTPNGAHDVE